MAIDFPSNPTTNQTFTPVAGTTYTWTGSGWELPAIRFDTQSGFPQATGVVPFSDNDTSIATTSFVQAVLQAGVTQFQCGRLVFVSATQLKFIPYNGDRLKIYGAMYAIPAAGVIIPNTNLYVNAVAGQNLAANTTYLVAMRVISGVLTPALFSSSLAHVPSGAPYNVGTEIRSGSESDSVIGMCRTNASAQFQDDAANRLVISWFNRRNIGMMSSTHTGGATSTNNTGTYNEISSAIRLNFLTWADEGVELFLHGWSLNNTAGWATYECLHNDSASGTGASFPAHNVSYGAGWYGCNDLGWGVNFAEGFHFATMTSYVQGGTSTYYNLLGGMIRG